MTHLLIRLTDVRDTYINEEGELRRKIWYNGFFVDTEIFVQDPHGGQYLAGCFVIFTFKETKTASGEIYYTGSWADEETKKIDKGTCEVRISLPTNMIEFLANQAKEGQDLLTHIAISKHDNAISTMSGEVHWSPSEKNPVGLELISIGKVPSTPSRL